MKLCGLGQPRWLTASPLSDGEADAAGDLRALGRIAAVWAGLTPRKGKSKAMPGALQSVLQRLIGEEETAYTSAAELLEGLDRVSSDAPANATAWERFCCARFASKPETPAGGVPPRIRLSGPHAPRENQGF